MLLARTGTIRMRQTVHRVAILYYEHTSHMILHLRRISSPVAEFSADSSRKGPPVAATRGERGGWLVGSRTEREFWRPWHSNTQDDAAQQLKLCLCFQCSFYVPHNLKPCACARVVSARIRDVRSSQLFPSNARAAKFNLLLTELSLPREIRAFF